MLHKLKEKRTLRAIGITIVGGVIILFWWLGWFSVFFYILGLYAAIYLASYLLKTTAIINVLLAVGGFILYGVTLVTGLYFLFLALQMMFTGSFFYGLFLFMFMGLLRSFFSLIPLAIGYILGAPLLFMSQDIETRFYFNNKTQSKIE